MNKLHPISYFGKRDAAVLAITLVAILVCTAVCVAQDSDSDPPSGTTEYWEQGGIGYTVTGDDTVSACRTDYTPTEIVIPAQVTHGGTDYNVTAIRDYGFSYCDKLTTVTLPSSVKTIGDYAFAYTKVSTLIVPDDGVETIGDYAFKSSGLKTIRTPDSTSTAFGIPASLDTFGEGAFYGCAPGVLTLPARFTEVKDYAFYSCTVTSVTLDGDVTKIGNHAFEKCTSLQSFTFHADKIVNIGDYAFHECKNLSVVQGDSFDMSGCVLLETIGNHAFESCTSWDVILRLPASLRTIGDYAFNEDSKVNIILSNDTGLTSIGDYAFSNTGTTSSGIPHSVEMGKGIFSRCSKLSSLDLANYSVIPDYTFHDCRINIAPSSHRVYYTNFTGQEIGDYAFSSAFSPSYHVVFSIPESVVRIGDHAFDRACNNDSYFWIQFSSDSNLEEIGDYCFSKCRFGGKVNGTICTGELPEGLKTIGNFAFYGAYYGSEGDYRAHIPASVETMGNGAFNCASMSNGFSIAGDRFRAKQIDTYEYALYSADYKTLYSYTGDSPSSSELQTALAGVNVIEGAFAYERINGMSNFRFPDSVTEIGDYSFYKSYFISLSSATLTIPGYVTRIGDSAFSTIYSYQGSWSSSNYNRDPLPMYFHFNGNSLTEIGDSAFMGGDSGYYFSFCTEELPDSVQKIGDEAFKYAFSWRQNDSVTYSFTLKPGVTEIGAGAFSNCDYLESFSFDPGSTITEIPDSFLYDCEMLSSFEIPSQITSIGDRAFNHCKSLTSINLSDSVTHIGQYALSDSGMTSFSIPANPEITEISDYMFAGCKSLSSLTIPSNITKIGSFAFNGCNSLRTLTVPSTVTDISDKAFANSSLREITMPMCNIGENIFQDASSPTKIIFTDSPLGYGADIDPNAFHGSGATVTLAGSILIDVDGTLDHFGMWNGMSKHSSYMTTYVKSSELVEPIEFGELERAEPLVGGQYKYTVTSSDGVTWSDFTVGDVGDSGIVIGMSGSDITVDATNASPGQHWVSLKSNAGYTYYAVFTVVEYNIPEEIHIISEGSRSYQAIGGSGQAVKIENPTSEGVAGLTNGSKTIVINGVAGSFTVVSDIAHETHHVTREVTVITEEPLLPGFTYDPSTEKYVRYVVHSATYEFDNVMAGADVTITAYDSSYLTPLQKGFKINVRTTSSKEATLTSEGVTINLVFYGIGFAINTSYSNIVPDGYRNINAFNPSYGENPVTIVSKSDDSIASLINDGKTVRIHGVSGSFRLAAADPNITVPAYRNVTISPTEIAMPDFTVNADGSYSREVVAGATYTYTKTMAGAGVTYNASTQDPLPDGISASGGGFKVCMANAGDTADFTVTADEVTITVHITTVGFLLEDTYYIASGATRVLSPVIGGTGHDMTVNTASSVSKYGTNAIRLCYPYVYSNAADDVTITTNETTSDSGHCSISQTSITVRFNFEKPLGDFTYGSPYTRNLVAGLEYTFGNAMGRTPIEVTKTSGNAEIALTDDGLGFTVKSLTDGDVTEFTVTSTDSQTLSVRINVTDFVDYSQLKITTNGNRSFYPVVVDGNVHPVSISSQSPNNLVSNNGGGKVTVTGANGTFVIRCGTGTGEPNATNYVEKTFTVVAVDPTLSDTGFTQNGSTYTREVVAGASYRFENIMGGAPLTINTSSSNMPPWFKLDSAGTGFVIENATTYRSGTSVSITGDNATIYVRVNVVSMNLPSSITLVKDDAYTYDPAVAGTGHTLTLVSGSNADVSSNIVIIRGVAGAFTVQTEEGNGCYQQAEMTVTVNVEDPALEGFVYNSDSGKWERELVAGAQYKFENVLHDAKNAQINNNPSWIAALSGSNNKGFTAAPASAEDSADFIIKGESATVKVKITVVELTIPSSITIVIGGSRDYTAVGGTGHSVSVSGSGVSVSDDGLTVTVFGANSTFRVYTNEASATLQAQKTVTVNASNPSMPGYERDDLTYTREVVKGAVYNISGIMAGAQVAVEGNPDWVTPTATGFIARPTSADQTAEFTVTADGKTITVKMTVIDFSMPENIAVVSGSSRSYSAFANNKHKVTVTSGTGLASASGNTVTVNGTAGDFTISTIETGAETQASFIVHVSTIEPSLPDAGFTKNADGCYSRELVSGVSYSFGEVLGGYTATLDGSPDWVAKRTDGVESFTASPAAGYTGTVTFTVNLALASDTAVVVPVTVSLTVVDFEIPAEISMISGGQHDYKAIGGTGHKVTVESGASVSDDGLTVTVAGSEGSFDIVTDESAGSAGTVTQRTYGVSVTVVVPNFPNFDGNMTDGFTRELVAGATYRFSNIMEGAEISFTDNPEWVEEYGYGFSAAPGTTDVGETYQFVMTIDGVDVPVKFTVVGFNLDGEITVMKNGTRVYTAVGGTGHTVTVTASDPASLASAEGNTVTVMPGTAGGSFTIRTNESNVADADQASLTVTVSVSDPKIDDAGFDKDASTGKWVRELVAGAKYDFRNLQDGGAVTFTGDLPDWIVKYTDSTGTVTGFTALPTEAGETAEFTATIDSVPLNLRITTVGFTMDHTMTLVLDGHREFAPAITGGHTITVASGATDGIVTLSGTGITVNGIAGGGLFTLVTAEENTLGGDSGQATWQVTVTVNNPHVPGFETEDIGGTTYYTREIVAGAVYDCTKIMNNATVTLDGSPDWVSVRSGTGVRLAPEEDDAGEYTFTVSGDGGVLHMKVTVIGWSIESTLYRVTGTVGGVEYTAIGDGHTVTIVSADPSTMVTASGNKVTVKGPGTFVIKTQEPNCVSDAQLSVAVETVDPALGGFVRDSVTGDWTREIVAGAVYQFPSILSGSQIELSVPGGQAWIQKNAAGTGIVISAPAGTSVSNVAFQITVQGAVINVAVSVIDFSIPGTVSVVSGGSHQFTVFSGSSLHPIVVDSTIASSEDGYTVTVTGPGTFTVSTNEDNATTQATKQITVSAKTPLDGLGFGKESENVYVRDLVVGGTYEFPAAMGGIALTETGWDSYSWIGGLSTAAGVTGFTASPDASLAGTTAEFTISADGKQITVKLNMIDFTIGDTVNVVAGGTARFPVLPEGHEAGAEGDADNGITALGRGDHVISVSAGSADGTITVYAVDPTATERASKEVSVHILSVSLPGFSVNPDGSYSRELVAGAEYTFGSIMGTEAVTFTSMPGWVSQYETSGTVTGFTAARPRPRPPPWRSSSPSAGSTSG
jgi:hypothetical protein